MASSSVSILRLSQARWSCCHQSGRGSSGDSALTKKVAGAPASRSSRAAVVGWVWSSSSKVIATGMRPPSAARRDRRQQRGRRNQLVVVRQQRELAREQREWHRRHEHVAPFRSSSATP